MQFSTFSLVTISKNSTQAWIVISQSQIKLSDSVANKDLTTLSLYFHGRPHIACHFMPHTIKYII